GRETTASPGVEQVRFALAPSPFHRPRSSAGMPCNVRCGLPTVTRSCLPEPLLAEAVRTPGGPGAQGGGGRSGPSPTGSAMPLWAAQPVLLELDGDRAVRAQGVWAT